MSAFAHLPDEKAKEAREILGLLYELSQCLCEEVLESNSEEDGICNDEFARGLVHGVRNRVLLLLQRERSRTA